MDFSYRYTPEQDRFRGDVARWLDAQAALWSGGPPSEAQEDDLMRGLASRGWLAPTEPVETGGGGLTTEHEAVLLEELDRRGLRGVMDGAASGLRRALHNAGTDEQRARLLPASAAGRLVVWRPLVSQEAELDAGDLGVRAYQDGDDYVLDGEAAFLGRGRWPDLLWTLAVGDPEAPPAESTAAFLVSGGLEGIAVQTPRHLVPGTIRLVTFDGVRVPRSSLLGREGEGWRHMRDAVADASEAPAAPPEDREVADLLRYAAGAMREGTALRRQPVFQQLLMEAYINSRILRLFRMRDDWMRASGRPLTYQTAETARLERRAAMRLAEIVRDVVGPHALLDRDDPRTPVGGSLELHARRSLAGQNPIGTSEPSAGVMAAGVGLGGRAPTARRP